MGVVYKLQPEIKTFILEKKRENPSFSCRNLAELVEKELRIKVSKSSINSLFKDAGLSMPVGRRTKKKRQRVQAPCKPQPEIKIEEKTLIENNVITEVSVGKPEERTFQVPAQEESLPNPAGLPAEAELRVSEEYSEAECTGAVLLKAADCLLGGSQSIFKAIQDFQIGEISDFKQKIDSLIYLPLFELDKEDPDNALSRLWPLIGRNFSLGIIYSYLDELQRVKTMNSDILRIISATIEEVRSLKISLADGKTLYFDGQLHTIWSTPYIPCDFDATLWSTKSYIEKYSNENAPLVFLMAPDTEIPSEEFFNFILGLELQENRIKNMTLCGNDLEELKTIQLEQGVKSYFIFGLWPWQFTEYRKLKRMEEFRPFVFKPLDKEFYLAEVEVEISQPIVKQIVTLRGYALKATPLEKPRLLIMTNLPLNNANPLEPARLYLNRWPNLEEALQDYRRKTELFSYTADSQRPFSAEGLNLVTAKTPDLKAAFLLYLKVLDLYVRWHFLPSSWRESGFSTIKTEFYDLKVVLRKQKDRVSAIFKPPAGFRHLKDLTYALARVNEREAEFGIGKRLWLSF